MRNIETLKQQKGTKVKDARDLTGLAEKENRNLTTEEKTKIDSILNEVRGMDEDIAREERLQALEMGKNTAKPMGEDRKGEKRAAFFKYIREGRSQLNREERSLVEDTNGLMLVPEDMLDIIYMELPKINPIRSMANIITTNVDKVSKRSLSEVQVGWGKLEAGERFTEGGLVPDKDYIYVEDLNGLAKIGKDQLADTDANLVNLISDSFSRAIANAENSAFVVGRGHDYGEPDGVTLDPTVIATYKDLATADTIVPDDLIDLEGELPEEFEDGASYMWNKRTESMLRKVKATSSYLWAPNLQTGVPRNFNGYPVYHSRDMVVPASTNTDRDIVAVIGDWKAGYTIVDRKSMAIQRLDELYAEAGLVGFLVHFRVGGGVVRPDAFRALDNNT